MPTSGWAHNSSQSILVCVFMLNYSRFKLLSWTSQCCTYLTQSCLKWRYIHMNCYQPTPCSVYNFTKQMVINLNLHKNLLLSSPKSQVPRPNSQIQSQNLTRAYTSMTFHGLLWVYDISSKVLSNLNLNQFSLNSKSWSCLINSKSISKDCKLPMRARVNTLRFQD